jgi:hypothetical protein
METLRRLYGLVKDFWIDFYRESKRGTQRHKRGIKVFVLSCSVVLLIIFMGLLRFSETATFCGVCHQMTAYIDS